MKFISVAFFFLLICEVSKAQVITLDGKKFNCDSAYTNYQLGFCAKFLSEQSIGQYQTTLKKVLSCLDTLIAGDKRYRQKTMKEDPNQNFEFWTDYEKIKKMVEESNQLFEQHANLEMNITGEFYGLGRERNIGENMRLVQLYENRTEELKRILELYCE